MGRDGTGMRKKKSGEKRAFGTEMDGVERLGGGGRRSGKGGGALGLAN